MTTFACHDASALAEAIAQRCDHARPHGDGWMARCPAHDDHTPSLSITPKGDAVLLHCFAKCSADAVMRALGGSTVDLFVNRPSNGHAVPVDMYDYVDAAGSLLSQKLRYHPKRFVQRRPDPANPGQYLSGPGCLQGVRKVLYNLPAVVAATTAGTPIYVTEGEKDAKTLMALGFTATTNRDGAGKWDASDSTPLAGADVIVLPDNDEAGQAHASSVAKHLQGHVKSLRVVQIPTAYKDVTDWVEAGATKTDLDALVQAATPPAPLAASLVSSVDLLGLTLTPKAPYLDWLTERSLAMVYGPRGVGKTLWLLELALCLSMPRPFLKWRAHQQVSVLFVDGEMALDSLQDRVRQLAGDHPPPGLHFLPSELVYARSGRDLTLTGAADRQDLDAMLDTYGIKVLILDNVSCLFPGLDESKKQDWEPINAWLIRLRHRGITVLVGHHAGKNGQQRGTSGREDALDTIIALTLPPGHQAQDGCHVHMRFEKSRGVKGPTVEPLDVRLDESPHGQVWTYAPLEATRTEQVKTMLTDGIPPKVIAEELAIHLSYVYRMKKQLCL